MTLVDQCCSFIKKEEGCELTAYQDGGGVWTIGYGETGKHVYKGVQWTMDEAERALFGRVSTLLSFLNTTLPTPLKDECTVALVSFIYNVGKKAFLSSTMLKLIRANHLELAAKQFDRWVYDNGKKIQGLVNRRSRERSLFENGLYSKEIE
jgi:lysozyme